MQQFFITWLTENYKDEKPVYLGGCHVGSKAICYKLVNGELIDVPSLKCYYDEVDDRIMYHLNHAVRTDTFSCAHVVSGDTDILVSLMYHYLTWSSYGLQEIWMHHGGSVTPLHESVSNLSEEVTRILPAIHALSGCDPTCKIGTKLQAFKAAKKTEHHSLKDFGIRPPWMKIYLMQRSISFSIVCQGLQIEQSILLMNFDIINIIILVPPFQLTSFLVLLEV